MKKFLEILKHICTKIAQNIKAVLKIFFAIFNTKTKVAAIALTGYIWFNLSLSIFDKIGTFILFGVLMLLIGYIIEDK